MNKINCKINYIPDNAIDLSENDLLGTSVYVDLLEKTIENCPTPYTIGLFGSWGSGKSSIIKTLQFKHKDEKNVFIYDAWKYSKDDFRRTFILELRTFLDLKTNEEEDLFYKDKTEEIKFKPKFDEWSGIILLVLFIASLILGFCWFRLDIVRNILATSSFLSLITFIHSIFRQSIIYQKVSVITSKIFAPEQFEQRFEKTIKDSKLNKKIIIAIDNIDRCHKDQVLEILLTIKNFLEKHNVVFIIPLDDIGLRNFLQMSHQDSNEFIRKIFNSIIQIKSFSDSHLYDFGIRLCNKYSIDIPKKENVISIVTQEFTRNPRKIIQFLNILQTELYLATLQENRGLIPEGTITKNIEVFVKFLILRDEYPELYQKIKDNKSLLEEINQSIINNEFTLVDNEKYKNDQKGLTLSLFEYRLLSRTLHINIDRNLMDALFVIKDTYKEIPDEIYADVISQNWERIKEKIDKKEIELSKLLDFIDKLIDEDVIRRNLFDTTGFNLISLIFKIIAEKNTEINSLPKNILSLLKNNQIWKHLFNFPSKELVISIKWLYTNHSYDFRDVIIKGLNEIDSKKVNGNQIKLLFHFITEFDNETLKKISNIFSDILKNNFGLYNQFKEIIISDKVKYLLTDDFIRSMVTQLNQDYLQNQTQEKVKIINSIKNSEVLSKDTVNAFIKKCIENAGVIQNNQIPVWFKYFKYWIENLIPFIEKVDDSNTINSIFNFINSNWTFIYQQFNGRQYGSDYIDVYKLYSSLIGELYIKASKINDQNKINDLLNKINLFYNYQISNDVSKHVGDIYVKIFDKTSRVDFIQNLISQFIGQNKIEVKKEIFETISIIVTKSDIELNSYKNNFEQLINHIFSLTSDDNVFTHGQHY